MSYIGLANPIKVFPFIVVKESWGHDTIDTSTVVTRQKVIRVVDVVSRQ
jgi:hypothetical protein